MIARSAILRRTFYAVIGILCSLVVLDWSLPYLIETAAIREQIHHQFNELTGGKIKFEKIDLGLFPWPRIEITAVSLSIPPKNKATADTIQIYPNLTALFSDQAAVAEIRLVSAKLTATLPQRQNNANESDKKQEEKSILEAFQSVINRTPKAHISLKDSSLQLLQGNKSVVELNLSDAEFNHSLKTLKFSVNCSSKYWKQFRISGHLNEESNKGRGEMRMEEFQMKYLDSIIPDTSPVHIVEGLANVNLRFTVDSPNSYNIAGSGSIPAITLSSEEELTEIRNDGFSIEANIANKSFEIELKDVNFEEPKLKIASARLDFQPENPESVMEVIGKSIDIESIQRVVSELFQDNHVTKIIFDILRGGTIPEIRIASRAKSLTELGQPANLMIQGTVNEGVLHIPGIDLDLSDSSGMIKIAEGLLQGTQLNTKLGKSVARNGMLNLRLDSQPLPIDLSFEANANLPDLLPLLSKISANKEIGKHLSKIVKLEGSAIGQVEMKGTVSNLKTQIGVSQLQLLAEHASYPFQLQVDNGELFLNDAAIRINHFKGRFGRSTFNDLSGNFSLHPNFASQILLGSSKLELPELQNWLSSFDSLKQLGRFTLGEDSRAHLLNTRLNGPLLKPEHWDFEVSGKLDRVEVTQLPDMEDPLRIKSAEFNANTTTLTVGKAQIQVLDADGTLSGIQKNYLSGINGEGRVSLNAQLGIEASRKLTRLFKLEPNFRMPPLSTESTEMSWGPSNKFHFSGALAIKQGPKIVIDANYDSDNIEIHRLNIVGPSSDAQLTLRLNQSLADFYFKGQISKPTVDPFLVKKNWLNGRVSGDIVAKLDLVNPSNSSAGGRLQGENINLSQLFNLPLAIDDFSLKTENNQIHLQSADFTLGNNHVEASGNLRSAPKTIHFNLDLTTPYFNVDSITGKQQLSPDNKSSSQSTRHNFPSFLGKIRFQAERFKYGQFTWTPFNADVLFSKEKTVGTLKDANLCGISTPVRLVRSAKQPLRVEINPSAKSQPLKSTLKCLFGSQFDLDGKFDLSGNLHGTRSKTNRSLEFQGPFIFNAYNGRIYKDLVFFRILDYLNATEILTGNYEKLKKNGFAYKSAHAKVKLDREMLYLNDISMKGPTMNLAGVGEIDLDNQSIKAKFLIAPLKTVNRILSYVPIVGNILEDVVSVPIQVEGPLEDPEVTPLAPSAISAQLKNVFSKTLNVPAELIRPIIPEE